MIMNIKYNIRFLLMLVMGSWGLTSQAQIKFGSNPSTINANSVLELESTSKGLLLPRVSLSATNSASPLSSHVAGMVVYNTASSGSGSTAVSPGYYYNDGTEWKKLCTPGDVYLSNVSLTSSTLPAGSSVGQLMYNTNASSGVPVGPVYWDGSLWAPIANTAWSTLGNAGTSSGTHFLGTTDASDLAIKTNNAEAMRVTSSGKVGIGTTTPAYPLHVKASADPFKIEGLTKGNMATDSILVIDASGVVKTVSSFNLAIADQTVGTVTAFAANSIPADYLECDGSAVSRTTYAKLFSLIGTTYGPGNGTSTFNLPDLRGEFIRGWSHGRSNVDVSRNVGSFQYGSNMAVGTYIGGSGYPIISAYNDRLNWLNNGWDSGVRSLSVGTGLVHNGTPIPGTGAGSTGISYYVPPTTTLGNYDGYLMFLGARPRNVAMVYAIKAKESIVLPSSTSDAVITAATSVEPWYSRTTGKGATLNTEDIYSMGKVMIGTSSVPTGGSGAKLIINSSSSGAVQIKDGTQGIGKVLSSDANGVGSWSSTQLFTAVTLTMPAPANNSNSLTGSFTDPVLGSVSYSSVTRIFNGRAVNSSGTTTAMSANFTGNDVAGSTTWEVTFTYSNLGYTPAGFIPMKSTFGGTIDNFYIVCTSVSSTTLVLRITRVDLVDNPGSGVTCTGLIVR